MASIISRSSSASLSDVESNEEIDEPKVPQQSFFSRVLLAVLALCRLVAGAVSSWRRSGDKAKPRQNTPPSLRFVRDTLTEEAELLRDLNAARSIQRIFRKRRTIRYYSAMKQAALRCSTSSISRSSTPSLGSGPLRGSSDSILQTLDLCIEVPTPRPDSSRGFLVQTGASDIDAGDVLLERLGPDGNEIAEPADLFGLDFELSASPVAKLTSKSASASQLHQRAVATALRSRLLQSDGSRSGMSSGSSSPGLYSSSSSCSGSQDSALNRSVGASNEDAAGRPRAGSHPPYINLASAQGGHMPMRWMSMSSVPDSRVNAKKSLTRSTADLTDGRESSDVLDS
jgi:hypothetical protein